MNPNSTHHQVLIVGGGTAGITVAARLMGKRPELDIAVLEPADRHFYQPLWTLVGGGVFPKQRSGRAMQSVIPKGVLWIKGAASAFSPQENAVTAENGRRYTYDYLVVASGIQIDWGKIPGLLEGLEKNGVCSNYSYETVDYTWDCIRSFEGGTAVFTQPDTPVKCGGAPQKICYLAEDYFSKHSRVRDKTEVIFSSGLGSIFAVAKYRETLEKVIKRKQIDARFNSNLIALDPERKIATFRHLDNGATEEIAYNMIHVTPPMSAPGVLKRSPLAGESGWVSVDENSLRHSEFANVFAIGDCSDLPSVALLEFHAQRQSLRFNLIPTHYHVLKTSI